MIGQIGHHRQIVLDHQHGAVGGDALDQLRDAVDVLMPHARRRLVEQQHFRIERQRGGDLERALAAIGQFDRQPVGKRGQTDIGDQFHRPLVELVEHGGRAPEIQRAAAQALQRDAHVFQDRHVREHGGDLERAHQPKPGHFGWLQGGDVAAVENDAPARRAEELGQHIETRGLAGAVRTDQGMDGPALNAQV